MILLVIGVLVTMSTVVLMNQTSGKFERFELQVEAQRQQAQMLAEGIVEFYQGEVYKTGAAPVLFGGGLPMYTVKPDGQAGWFTESPLAVRNVGTGLPVYQMQFLVPATALPLAPSELSVDALLYNTPPTMLLPPAIHHAVWLTNAGFVPLVGYPWPATGYFIRL